MTRALAIVLAVIWLSGHAQAGSCWACMHGCTEQQRLAFCEGNKMAMREVKRECLKIAKREKVDPIACRFEVYSK